MAKKKKRESKKTNGNGAKLGFEAKLVVGLGLSMFLLFFIRP